jgi:hypothetical protein
MPENYVSNKISIYGIEISKKLPVATSRRQTALLA